MMYLALAGGLLVLLFCGDLLVRGAVALAVRLGIPSIIIGLTIVAFGTSAPELVVSIHAVLKGAPGIAIGNVVGSNIANILLVLGLPAIIYPTLCNQPSIRRNTFLMLGTSVLFVVLCFSGALHFWQGALLFILLLLFLAYSAYYASRCPEAVDDEVEELLEGDALPTNGLKITAYITLGILGLPLGAHLFVLGGTDIARAFGVSEAAIGLSLIAFGTSLPELATTVVAALRKQADVAVGNVIGSNIFNLLGIMGVTAMVGTVPIPVNFLWFDLWVMLIAALLIVPFAMARTTITRSAGAVFVAGYCSYMYFLFLADRAASAVTP